MKSEEKESAVSERKTFKDSIISYLYISQGQGQTTHGGGGGGRQNFDPN